MSGVATEDEFVKWLVVMFPTGERYGVPARIVAEDRASYYAQRDPPDDEEKRGEKRQQELDDTLENPAELIDWAHSNMEWDDLRHHAERLDSAERDLGGLWMDADFNVKPANEVEYD
ncbi:MAG TPA: hypothetical protein VFJ06_02220 [Halococcus sp.]|nr:hypothetical protein [Halococcus sp.]